MDDEAGQWWMDIGGIIGYHSCSWLWWIGARSLVLVLKHLVKVMAPSFQFLILHILSIFHNKKWHWCNPWWKLIGHIITWASPKPRITWKAEERATRDAKRDRNKSQLDGNHWRFQHSHQKPVEHSLDLFMFVLNFSDFLPWWLSTLGENRTKGNATFAKPEFEAWTLPVMKSPKNFRFWINMSCPWVKCRFCACAFSFSNSTFHVFVWETCKFYRYPNTHIKEKTWLCGVSWGHEQNMLFQRKATLTKKTCVWKKKMHFHCISSILGIDLPLDKHPQFGQKQGLSLVGKFVAINQFVVAEMGNSYTIHILFSVVAFLTWDVWQLLWRIYSMSDVVLSILCIYRTKS